MNIQNYIGFWDLGSFVHFVGADLSWSVLCVLQLTQNLRGQLLAHSWHIKISLTIYWAFVSYYVSLWYL